MRLRVVRTTLAGLMVSAAILAGQAASGAAFATATVASTPVPSDGADARVNAVARVGDRIYVGGEFTSVGGQPRAGLAALDAVTGRLITTWRADVTGSVQAVAPSSDGTALYVGGDFTQISGVTRRHLAAVSTATGAVAAWSPRAIGGPVLALAAAGGHVWVGGKFTSIGSVARPYLAAVSSAGTLETGFDARIDGAVWDLALSPDLSRLYAGGAFHTVGGETRRHVAALDPATGGGLGWRPQLSCPVLGLAATSSEVYLACGGSAAQLGNSVMAYSASSGAQLWIQRTDGNVQTVARLGDAVYAGGHFTKVNGVARKKAAAFDAASGALQPWDPRPNTALGVKTLVADIDSLWMGGDFTTIRGISQPHLARFR